MLRRKTCLFIIEKKRYVLIKEFNRFIYDHSLHRGRKHFYRYCLHAFITEEISKRHIKDCFEINGKKRLRCLRKVKVKSSFMIYADFESILGSGDNGKQNPNESYTNKYQKHVACSYDYKLERVDDKFSQPFKSYSGKDAIYTFITSLIEESKCCSDMMEKHFNKKFVMTKKDNEDFENSTNCWIWENDYIDGNVKVRNRCHITGKYRGSAHRYCNINIKLNHKIPAVLHNLKNYDLHLIMEELG